jgi:alpha-1,2-mannosyltransferase
VASVTWQLGMQWRTIAMVAARIAAFGIVIFRLRDGLLASRTLDQDTIVYLAAAERLNAGHRLYALSPGDRPIPVNPPFFDSPFVSPPFAAIPFRPLALLPTDVVLGLWWLICFVAMAGVLVWLAWRVPIPTALMAILLATPIAYQIGHANNQSLVLAGTIVTWWLMTRTRDRAAGSLIGLLTVTKIFPAMLVVWAAVERRWTVAAAAIVAGVVLTLATAVLSGPTSLVEFLGSHVSPTRLSLTWRLTTAGLSPTVALVIVLALGMVLVAALGRWPDLSFAVAVVLMTFAPPAVNAHSEVLLLAVLAPLCWPLRSRDEWSVDRPRASRTDLPLDRGATARAM